MSSNNEPDEFDLEFNVIISLFGAIPFSLLLCALVVVISTRKIEDFFLRWSMGVLVAAVGLRVAMSFIAIFLYKKAEEETLNYKLLMLKIQVFEFSLPYYAFLMVFISLNESTFTFY